MKGKVDVRTKRIFIAVRIVPGDALLKMMRDFHTQLRDERIKWTDTSNFHVTIAFLGDTDVRKIDDVRTMLGEVSKGSPCFELVLKGAGLFKGLKDPRVLWTGLEYSDEFVKLHHSVKSGLDVLGITIEDRNFNPHLTLGRIKKINDSDGLKLLIDKFNGIEIQKQTISSIILYESILSPSGPVYKPLGDYPLAN